MLRALIQSLKTYHFVCNTQKYRSYDDRGINYCQAKALIIGVLAVPEMKVDNHDLPLLGQTVANFKTTKQTQLRKMLNTLVGISNVI